MKIILVNSFYPPDFIGGAEKIVQLLAEGIVEHGHEAIVVSSNIGGSEPEALINGVRIHKLSLPNIYLPLTTGQPTLKKAVWHLIDAYNPGSQAKFQKLITDLKPDLVHTHGISGFSVSIWRSIKQMNIPLVHTLHDYYLLCPKRTMYKNGRICSQQCMTCKLYSVPKIAALGLVDTLIGVSHFILEQHTKYASLPTSRKIVIHNGVEPLTSGMQSNWESMSSEKHVRFGYLGQIGAHKGIEELIDAFVSLQSPIAELIIAGKGDQEYEDKLRGKSKSHTNIRWL